MNDNMILEQIGVMPCPGDEQDMYRELMEYWHNMLCATAWQNNEIRCIYGRLLSLCIALGDAYWQIALTMAAVVDKYITDTALVTEIKEVLMQHYSNNEPLFGGMLIAQPAPLWNDYEEGQTAELLADPVQIETFVNKIGSQSQELSRAIEAQQQYVSDMAFLLSSENIRVLLQVLLNYANANAATTADALIVMEGSRQQIRDSFMVRNLGALIHTMEPECGAGSAGDVGIAGYVLASSSAGAAGIAAVMPSSWPGGSSSSSSLVVYNKHSIYGQLTAHNTLMITQPESSINPAFDSASDVLGGSIYDATAVSDSSSMVSANMSAASDPIWQQICPLEIAGSNRSSSTSVHIIVEISTPDNATAPDTIRCSTPHTTTPESTAPGNAIEGGVMMKADTAGAGVTEGDTNVVGVDRVVAGTATVVSGVCAGVFVAVESMFAGVRMAAGGHVLAGTVNAIDGTVVGVTGAIDCVIAGFRLWTGY